MCSDGGKPTKYRLLIIPSINIKVLFDLFSHLAMYVSNCTMVKRANRKLFVKFSGFLLYVIMIIYVTELVIQIGEVKDEFVERCTPDENSALLMFAKDKINIYHRFCEIHNKYKDILESCGRHIYKPVERFIDYGPPVKKFLSENTPKFKRILVWTSFFKNSTFIPKKLSCAEGVICDVTYNKSELLSSDAIIIHGNNLLGTHYLPSQRKPSQRWVHFLMETPYNSFLRFHHFSNIYNFTATYRADSDIRATYFTLQRRQNNLGEAEYNSVFAEIAGLKSGFVAAMISNCDQRRTSRLNFIQHLNKTIRVDLFGKCGKLKCKKNTKECDDVMKMYKFYLSLENGNCRDYITEKVGNALLRWSSVPVVMGGADPGDYEHLLPPGSYIHTSGFESPEDLAEYLILLNNNPILYEQYHQWRKWYTGSLFDSGLLWCQLCIKLYNNSMPVQTYRDLDGWYKQDVCKV